MSIGDDPLIDDLSEKMMRFVVVVGFGFETVAVVVVMVSLLCLLWCHP